LGIAKFAAGEAGGLELFKQAVDDHRRQVRLDGRPEELQHFVHLRHLSEAAIFLAGAEMRSGRTTEARAALKEAKDAATQILSVADVQESLRQEAKQFVSTIDKAEAPLSQAGR
jgi:hypothetical protein